MQKLLTVQRLCRGAMSGVGPNPDFLLGERTSASVECRHWSGRAVRWSSCAILLRMPTFIATLWLLLAATAAAAEPLPVPKQGGPCP